MKKQSEVEVAPAAPSPEVEVASLPPTPEIVIAYRRGVGGWEVTGVGPGSVASRRKATVEEVLLYQILAELRTLNAK